MSALRFPHFQTLQRAGLHIYLGLILVAALLALLPVQAGGAAPISRDIPTSCLQPTGSRCFVDASATTGLNNGNSWTDAYTSLQSALNDVNCSEIWVASGIYRPGPAGNRYSTFGLKSGVAIYGGFAGTETLLSQRNWKTNVTTLSGDLDGDGRDDHDSYHVVTGANNATLDGFTITGGNANGSANPDNYGGGIYNSSSSPVLENLVIIANPAVYGGGIYNANSSPTLTNVIFRSNPASGAGGGMYNTASSPVLTNVTFSYNSAPDYWGGGLYNTGSSPNIRNSILWNNYYGGEMVNDGGSAPTISYSDVQGGCPSGAICDHLLAADPLFVSEGSGDLHLQIASPALNAGFNDVTSPPLPLTDLDGRRRIYGTVDLGAYEFPIRFVKWDASGTNTGYSWTDAYTSLQTALGAAASGDVLWVSAGVYTPGSAGNRDSTFVLKSGVAIYGGFAGTETLLSQRNWKTNLTTLSGDLDGDGRDDDDSYHVVVSTANNTRLDGFTITGGNANGIGDPELMEEYGGGMLNIGSGLSLANIIFSNNQAWLSGGGMYNKNINYTYLTNVIFLANSASTGGGMYNQSSSPNLVNVIFLANHAQNGAGMYNAFGSMPGLHNVTFYNNHATNPETNGGVMFNTRSSAPHIRNSILWGDTGGEIVNYRVVDSNDLTYAHVLYSDVQGGCPALTECVNLQTTDPLFIDSDGPDNTPGTLDDNLRLGFGSPAIESGTNESTFCASTDLDGLPRPNDGDAAGGAICDMGAYEAGEMDCSLDGSWNFTFPNHPGISVHPTAAGDPALACVYVDEMGITHPVAAPSPVVLDRERYWSLRGLLGDKQTAASDFSVNVTLPHAGLPSPLACRYAGGSWSCGVSSHTTTTVTWDGVTAFSDWADGNNGPTAVTVSELQAGPAMGGVRVTWEAATGFDIAGFNLYRSQAGSEERLQLNTELIIHTGGLDGASYIWIDLQARPGETYSYTLEVVHASGGASLFGPVQATAGYWRWLPAILRD